MMWPFGGAGKPGKWAAKRGDQPRVPDDEGQGPVCDDKYRLLFENASEAFMVLDPATLKIEEANAAVYRMLGYSRGELRGKPIHEIFPEENSYIESVRVGTAAGAYVCRIMKKDGSRGIGEVVTVYSEDSGSRKIVMSVRDAAERVSIETKMIQLNNLFASLGPDFKANIDMLTKACGEIMGGTCAIYNRLRDGMLYSLGVWNVPSGHKVMDDPQGHMCFDVIKKREKGRPYIVKDLEKSSYCKSDPNVKRYGLRTYIGYPVFSGEECVGSLCVVYDKDVEFTDLDIYFLSIMAMAINREEDRTKSADALKESEEAYRILVESANHPIAKINREGKFLFMNSFAAGM
ncbi:MAG: PAS domain S-box protein, partial [Candidatus Omnitrophica bacterium]|nr:PAS domain S-box protein [Candidatus Omnitrophota bacterium]